MKPWAKPFNNPALPLQAREIHEFSSNREIPRGIRMMVRDTFNWRVRGEGPQHVLYWTRGPGGLGYEILDEEEAEG